MHVNIISINWISYNNSCLNQMNCIDICVVKLKVQTHAKTSWHVILPLWCTNIIFSQIANYQKFSHILKFAHRFTQTKFTSRTKNPNIKHVSWQGRTLILIVGSELLKTLQCLEDKVCLGHFLCLKENTTDTTTVFIICQTTNLL